MTKTEEKILSCVKDANKFGYLAGLVASPNDPSYHTRQYRFVKRLHEAGKIVWVDWTPKMGSGWALPGKF